MRFIKLLPYALAVAVSACFALLSQGTPIDRHAVIERHRVRVEKVDPESPLSVGNGDFAFTVDASGLQSLEKFYHDEGLPLETLSTWAWHAFPNVNGYKMADTMVAHPFHGRTILFAGNEKSPAGVYFRQNPHPIPLGQIAFLLKGRELAPTDLQEVHQDLDLWTGLVTSSYKIAGVPVFVQTVAQGEGSVVAVRVKSALLERGDLQVRVRFAYSHKLSVKNKPPLVWDKEDAHKTELVSRGAQEAVLSRTLDDSRYSATLHWNAGASLEKKGAHEFRLARASGDELEFVVSFSPEPSGSKVPSFASVVASSASAWESYWTKGAAVDFAGSKDPRASELERRIVLSLYLMRVNYAGAFPPAESGLTHISWFGKHNTEMYFWHASQFYQWGHVDLLERGLAWYQKILPLGKAEAATQGFDGVRWPKMCGPDGRPTPGGINPYIIWNQPNPIYLCELVYRAKPTRETLEKYSEIVFESAKFLASFAHYDEASGRYVLGPPIKNVSEKTGPNSTQNPTFELAYWYYGLQVAQAWRKRLGLEPEPRWSDIQTKLTKLPAKDGLLLEIETFPEMWQKGGNLPTSMLLSLGYLPKTDYVDLDMARRTFDELNRRSNLGVKRWVSWALGQGALTAARVGEYKTAVDIVTNDNPAARFMGSGHVRRPAEPVDCPAFLPVNASLLAATGLMLGGWDTAPEGDAPGFPKDGSWTIKVEGFNKMP